MKKTKINLVSLKPMLKGKKWEKLTKKEQLAISQKVVELIQPK